MASVATKSAGRKVSRRALKPVTVTLAGPGYDPEMGAGCVVLNGRMYYLERVTDGPRTTGLAFCPLDDHDSNHHVDFTDAYGWRCDCPDATFNPDRPLGCKHLVAARRLARELKGGAA